MANDVRRQSRYLTALEAHEARAGACQSRAVVTCPYVNDWRKDGKCVDELSDASMEDGWIMATATSNAALPLAAKFKGEQGSLLFVHTLGTAAAYRLYVLAVAAATDLVFSIHLSLCELWKPRSNRY